MFISIFFGCVVKQWKGVRFIQTNIQLSSEKSKAWALSAAYYQIKKEIFYR
jgi:hypothetical protein